METISILFAGFSAPCSEEFSSCLERSLGWAGRHGSRTFVLSSPSASGPGFGGAEVVERESWDAASIASEIAECCRRASADTAVFAWADCPFLNDRLTEELIRTHGDSMAEYTFADGYPYGLAPEVIDGGAAAIVAQLAQGKGLPASRDALMSIMKGDINSFEVETVLSGTDFRQLRLSLHLAGDEGARIACGRLAPLLSGGEDAEAVARVAAGSPGVLRTVPYCVDVQVCPRSRREPLYSPSRGGVDFSGFRDMELGDFERLMDGVAALNPGAAVSPSLFGEPLLRPDFPKVAEAVLSRGLRLVVETDGVDVTGGLADEIAALPNARDSVDWIVQLDAATEGTYSAVHGGSAEEFRAAVAAVGILSERFPSRVYPQMVRMNANEAELEKFFRFWRDGGSPSLGKVIIRKLDTLCGLLPDERPADLSPLVRFPCWHQRRDMAVLADGSVPLCRSAVRSPLLGNALADGVAAVWEAGAPVFAEHAAATSGGDFRGMNGGCGGCDEFYTFSF